ncbi:MAG: hypothetical protein FJ014_01865 [Chloroflexi bacterium]|nr:hypothetical protein [Chloroflexota bacterium]
MIIVGLILKASYQLSRHRMGPLRLNLVPLLFALASGLIWRAGSLTGGQTALIIVLCLALVLITLLARRQGFIVFRRRELSPSSGHPELAPDEKVAVRATGFFEVRDKQRYFVEVTADFATMETREHIVMGRMLDSRFLVGAPKDDAGWWYIFFKPHTISEIGVGEVHFGLRARPAIKVGYEAGEGRLESVYLSFDEPLQMQRVLEDLHRDASVPH